MTEKRTDKNYTVITGLFDIKRGDWKHYTRPFAYYLHFFRNVCSLYAPMIIFIQKKNVGFAERFRENIPYETTIVPLEIEELSTYKYKPLLEKICSDPVKLAKHPNPACPEVCQPMYPIVVCNKIDLMLKASKIATNENIIYMDSGYLHGSRSISEIKAWQPKSLAIKDKLSIIMLKPLSDIIDKDPVKFCNQYIDILNGGVMITNKEIIEDIHKKYYEIVEEMIVKHEQSVDDQDVMTIFTLRYPELMNLVPGGWYSAFEVL